MNRKSNTAALDYEAALAAEVAQMKQDHEDKLRRRAAALLESRGIVSPDEEARRASRVDVERRSMRAMGFVYPDEVPPFDTLPFLTPGNTIRVRAPFGLTAEGVTITRYGATKLLCSPMFPDAKSGMVWVYANGVWSPASVPMSVTGDAVTDVITALVAAGVKVSKEAWRFEGTAPMPVARSVWDFLQARVDHWG